MEAFHHLFNLLIFILCLRTSTASFLERKTRLKPNSSQYESICFRMSIWNWDDFRNLQGCNVIEGSLKITIMWEGENITDIHEYRDLSFPELREITGYLLLFNTPKLYTLKTLFPNLAVIRGQELVDSYALIIYKMPDMQEIGLPALTDIWRGSVWIVDNANLCYVDTVDWDKILKQSSAIQIFKNKRQCPNMCQKTCPHSDLNKSKLCWSSDACQIVHSQSCPECNGNPCYGDVCCHKECLGGCTGEGPSDCFVCKGVFKIDPKTRRPICLEKCPVPYYEFLHRRCLTQDECLNVKAVPLSHSGSCSKNSTGKTLSSEDKDECVLECPKNTEVSSDGKSCIHCVDQCKKDCPGRTIDSIEAARELDGCTKIEGALKIHIRRGSDSKTIANELKQSLDRIEEIDDYLEITYTYSIYSFNFLESLKVIGGNKLFEDKYALVVKSNDNLISLWNSETKRRNITILNKKARVLFHYNQKLCPAKIWEFVESSGIDRRKDDKIDVGITNGDKVPCNTKKLKVKVRHKTNHTVTIQWENFRRNLTRVNHLLNYEIHYKEAVNYPKRNESKFDDRDACVFDGWIVLEITKMTDSEVKQAKPLAADMSSLSNEPEWENERLIVKLKPYTFYALYVKAIVIPDPDAHALNNNTGAESDIIYFRTHAGKPSKPRKMMVGSNDPHKITLSWEVPENPNGDLVSFRIYHKVISEVQSLQDQRDYCGAGRYQRGFLEPSSSTSSDPIISIPKTPKSENTFLKPDAECCACSAPTGFRKKPSYSSSKIDEVLDEDAMFDVIMGHHVFPNQLSACEKTNDDPATNEIRGARRRRRRATSEEAVDNKHVLFPSPVTDSPEDDDVLLSEEEGFVFAGNVTYDPKEPKYLYTLENLTHYTRYDIGIKACRKVDPTNMDEVSNRNNFHFIRKQLCSDFSTDRIRTYKSEEADIINPRSISVNVTENKRLHIRWTEPEQPNGVIMAYVLFIQRVSGGKDDMLLRKCVTHKTFVSNGRNYTFYDPLYPGNYSLKIQAASLAADGPFSVKYFYIDDISRTNSKIWVLAIVLPVILVVVLASFIGFYCIRVKYFVDKRPVIISANPEYMPNVDIPEDWEVPRENCKIGRQLGEGSFGTVYEGVLLDCKRVGPQVRCAVKKVLEETPSEDRILFLKEAALMTKLSCNHVVKLLGVVSKSQPILVIMELMVHGDLKKHLRSRRPDHTKPGGTSPPTVREILRMAAEIADGMAYLHSQLCIHRDLAARNCMVAENYVVKVGDFGMTKEMESDYYKKLTKGRLPVRWMAPESLEDGIFTNKSDVWSFGVVLWEMTTLAAQPYQGLGNDQVLKFVKSRGVMEKPENCPKMLSELMDECWRFYPDERPTFINILETLTLHVDSSFAEVSFYHSPEGVDYRTRASLLPPTDELIIRAPLGATVDEFDEDQDDFDDEDINQLSQDIIDDLNDTATKRLITTDVVASMKSPDSSCGTASTYLDNAYGSFALSSLGANAGPVRNGTSSYAKKRGSPPRPSSMLNSSHMLQLDADVPDTSGCNYAEPHFTTPLLESSICGGGGTSSGTAASSVIEKEPPTTYTSVRPVGKLFGFPSIEGKKGSNGTTGGNGFILPKQKTTQF